MDQSEFIAKMAKAIRDKQSGGDAELDAKSQAYLNQMHQDAFNKQNLINKPDPEAAANQSINSSTGLNPQKTQDQQDIDVQNAANSPAGQGYADGGQVGTIDDENSPMAVALKKILAAKQAQGMSNEQPAPPVDEERQDALNKMRLQMLQQAARTGEMSNSNDLPPAMEGLHTFSTLGDNINKYGDPAKTGITDSDLDSGIDNFQKISRKLNPNRLNPLK